MDRNSSPRPKLRPKDFGPAGVKKKRTLLQAQYEDAEEELDQLLSKKGKLSLKEDKRRRELKKTLIRLGSELGDITDYEDSK